LPIFATLCGNDYFNVEKFPEFRYQIKKYSGNLNRTTTTTTTTTTTSMKYQYFQKIINFILDCCETLKIDISNENSNSHRK